MINNNMNQKGGGEHTHEISKFYDIQENAFK